MLAIDPCIIEHEIKTYPNAKPVRQRLRTVNPRKAPTIKAEIEKLLNAGQSGFQTPFWLIRRRE